MRPTDLEFAGLARARGWISGVVQEQSLQEADRCQAVGLSKPVEEILVDMGALSSRQVRALRDELGWNLSRPRVGDYEIVRRIGLGGMGTVFEAFHVRLKQKAALKILLPRYAEDELLARRFVEEGRTLARLNDPHLVHAIDSGRDGEYYYLAMEFVEGEDLRQLLGREGTLDVYSATLVVRDVATALSVLETKGLVHRDVKPANVLISRRGEVKLGDLGLQKAADVAAGDNERFVCGTPHYIAPEQIRRREDIDVRSDLYSLAATWFHLICGKPPFTGSTTEAILRAHLTQTPRVPSECRCLVPLQVQETILRWLSKDREARPRSAAAAVAEVDRVLDGLRPAARSWPRALRPMSRAFGSPAWKWTVATIAAVALVAVVLGVVILSPRGDEPLSPRVSDGAPSARPPLEWLPPRKQSDGSGVQESTMPPGDERLTDLEVAQTGVLPTEAAPPSGGVPGVEIPSPAPPAARSLGGLAEARSRYERSRRVVDRGLDLVCPVIQEYHGRLRAHAAMVDLWSRDFHADEVAVEPRGELPLEVILRYDWKRDAELADFRAVPGTWSVEDGNLYVRQGPFGASLDTVAWFMSPIRLEGRLTAAAHLVVGFGILRVAPGYGVDGRVWSHEPGRDEVSVLSVPITGPGDFEVVVTPGRVMIVGGGRRASVAVASADRGRVLLRMEQGSILEELRIEAAIEPHWGKARLELLRGE